MGVSPNSLRKMRRGTRAEAPGLCSRTVPAHSRRMLRDLQTFRAHGGFDQRRQCRALGGRSGGNPVKLVGRGARLPAHPREFALDLTAGGLRLFLSLNVN